MINLNNLLDHNYLSLNENGYKYFLAIVLTTTIKLSMAQQPDTIFLKQFLESKPQVFKQILNHPYHNEVQIMYTQIDRDQNNKPSFKTFTYHLNPKHYFYPASTVKLAAVIFALEKINDHHWPNRIKYAPMYTDSGFLGQTKVNTDSSAKNGQPSITHYIKKILLTSDNDAFNRLYEFIGRAELNSKLKKYGMTHSRIVNRLAIGDEGESARHTNPIIFKNIKSALKLPAQYDENEYPLKLTNLKVGRGYINSNDELVNEPFSLENKNVFTIDDQQSLMRRLMMPEAFPETERFNLTAEDYKLIYTYMSMYPTESKEPSYSQDIFWPTYGKMLYYGRDKTITPDPKFRIFNKYGDSYGFIIDNAYIVNFSKGIEFFLTAVVQSNEDGIYNDNKYEYETVCYPFMKNLGIAIYEHETERLKSHKADLRKYQMNYK